MKIKNDHRANRVSREYNMSHNQMEKLIVEKLEDIFPMDHTLSGCSMRELCSDFGENPGVLMVHVFGYVIANAVFPFENLIFIHESTCPECGGSLHRVRDDRETFYPKGTPPETVGFVYYECGICMHEIKSEHDVEIV